MAHGQAGDWLEELPIDSEVTVRIKLLSGSQSYFDLVEGEPEWTTKLVRGYQVTEILGENQCGR
jgi:hypothetical protein